MSARPLADRLAPFIQAHADAWVQIGQLAAFLRESPNAHPDLRRQKLRAWGLLEREVAALDSQMERVWELWLKERANRPMGMPEALAEIETAVKEVR